MSVITDALGVVSGVLGIVDFFKSNLAGINEAKGSIVSIKVGLGDDDSDNMGGGIGAIYGFDINNNYIGKAPGGSKIGVGGIKAFTIDQAIPGQQADFVSVEAMNDAICIAWVTVGMFDESAGGVAWTGDVGSMCGQFWYAGNQVAGEAKETKEAYRPRCTWIDGDDTAEFTTSAFKFGTRAYGEDVEDTLNNGKICSETIFAGDAGPIHGIPGAKRSTPIPVRKPWMEQRLIMSNSSSSHSAEELCGSATSYGPDFVGADGQFCDMGSKKLSPLCAVKDVEGCVDVDAAAMKIHKRSSVAKRSTSLLHKEYTKVSQWE